MVNYSEHLWQSLSGGPRDPHLTLFEMAIRERALAHRERPNAQSEVDLRLLYPFSPLEHQRQDGYKSNREGFKVLARLIKDLEREPSLDDAKHGRSPRESSSSSLQGTTYCADVVLEGVEIKATADTGASSNLISKALADSMRLTLEPGTARHAWLPSGKKLYSPGLVKTTGRFTGEEKEFNLTCMVVENTTHPLVLGSKLLRVTKTFKKHMHRLKKVVSNVAALRLNLVGEEQEDIAGFLNGAKCEAVPDSGSDIMVLSGKYAKARRLHIYRGRRKRQLAQFIDGSARYTDGIVKNVWWLFRKNEKPIRCDFHVMDNLPVDAILSGAMIDKYDVFTEYDDLIIQNDALDDQSGIYNIRLAEKCRAEITKLENSFWQDMDSDQVFSLSMIDREKARRFEISDRIEGLLVHERQRQLESERNRQAYFDEEWKKHRQRVAASGRNDQDGSANALPPQAGPPIAGACQTTPSSPRGAETRRFWKEIRQKRLYLWKTSNP